MKPATSRVSARRIRLLALLAGAFLTGACGDASDPSRPEPTPVVSVALGDTVLADLSGDTLLYYDLHSDTAVEFAVFLQNESGEALLGVWDTAVPNNTITYTTPATDPVPGHLLWHRTARVPIGAGESRRIGVLRKQGRGRTRFWVYPVNRAPEVIAPAAAPGDTVTGESLENSADVDEFTITLGAGTEIIMFARRLQLSGVRGAAVELRDLSGTLLTSTDLGLPPELEGNNTGRIPIAQGGAYRMAVSGFTWDHDSAESVPLPFQVQLRTIDRGPENSPVTLVPGDTLESEAIDFVGDIDEFEVAVQAGEEYNLAVQQLTGAPNILLLGTAVEPWRQLLAPGADAVLGTSSTGRFTVGATGLLHLRVESQSADNFLRGPYRLFLYRIDRAPEFASATIPAGGGVTGEAIDFPGDIDEFLVIPAAEDSVSLRLTRPAGMPGNLTLEWVDPDQPNPPCPAVVDPAVFPCSSYLLPALAPGLLVRVIEPHVGIPPAYRETYVLQTTGLSAAPESGAAVISIGDTVTGTIEVAGDIDHFRFSYRHADQINIAMLTVGPVAGIYDSVGAYLGYFAADPPGSGRLTLPVSGTYIIQASGAAGQQYSFALVPSATVNEVAPQAVGIGDSVTTEATDFLSDMDEFVLTAPPGTYAQAFIAPAAGLFRRVETWHAGDTVPRQVGDVIGSWRFIVPASGEVRLRVLEHRGGGPVLSTAYSMTGPYSLWVRSYDPGPETVPATLTLGVVISGEAIEQAGDLDDFTFSCSTGQNLTATITAGVPSDWGIGAVMVQLLAPSSGAVLATAETNDSDPASTPPVMLSAGGICAVRVTSNPTSQGSGPYILLVQ